MPFSELIAQDRAVAPLRAALRRGALHHAYLLGGPAGAGKATAARLLAQAANCEGGAPAAGGHRDDPCGACGPCRKIEKGIHPDVLVLKDERTMVKEGRWEPRSGKTPSRDILVDQIRDVVDHRLALRRFEGRRRFVVIDPADAMNPQAQNALLKTLEEPPEDTTLVLVASSPDALLPTIRSRCLRISFAPDTVDAVAARLGAEGVAPDLARLAAELSGAALDRARDLARREASAREKLAAWEPDAGGKRKARPADGPLTAQRALLERAAALGSGDPLAWLAFAAEAGEGRDRAAETCALLEAWLRDVLAVHAGATELVLGTVAGATRHAAETLGPAEALRRRDEVRRTAAALRQNAAPVLALERMLIGWFHGRP